MSGKRRAREGPGGGNGMCRSGVGGGGGATGEREGAVWGLLSLLSSHEHAPCSDRTR